MSIYKKLLQIQKEVKGLGKDTTGFNYQYVSGSKVLGAIKPIMNELGLLLKQELLSIEKEIMNYDLYNKYDKRVDKKTEVLYICKFRFTWIDSETGETDINDFYAAGQNAFDKGVGSATTYAERYFLLKFFHIPTDEDDIDNQRLSDEANIIPKKKDDEDLTKGMNIVNEDKKKEENSWTYLPKHMATNALKAHLKKINKLESFLKKENIKDLEELPIERIEEGLRAYDLITKNTSIEVDKRDNWEKQGDLESLRDAAGEFFGGYIWK